MPEIGIFKVSIIRKQYNFTLVEFFMHRKYANKNYKKVTPIFHPDCQKIQKGIDFSRHNRYT